MGGQYKATLAKYSLAISPVRDKKVANNRQMAESSEKSNFCASG